MPYTDQERAYAAAHQDYDNGLIDVAEYHAAFRPEPSYLIGRMLAWLLTGLCAGLALGAVAALVYVALSAAGVW